MAKMAFSTGLFLSSILGAQGAVTSIKIGGITKPDGYGGQARKVFKALETKIPDVTVTYTWVDYNKDTVAAAAKNMTTGADAVDFFVPPYGSTATKSAIGGITNTDVTILVWGGASDSIFEGDSAPCKGKKCLGFFTKGSEYMKAGLEGIQKKVDAKITVGVITNDNAFSGSVANGVVDIASASDKIEVLQKEQIARGAELGDEDAGRIQKVMDAKPDVIAIAGHSSGDVENIVIKVQKSTFRPQAIISTNSLTKGATDFFAEKGEADAQECIMMPTQWAMDATATDTLLQWTKTKFETIVEGATYHAASAGAAAITVAKIMEAVNKATSPAITDMSNVTRSILTLPFDTFYGPINWNDDGSIKGKPMYVMQKIGADKPIVFPAADQKVEAKVPLTECEAWDTAVAGSGERVLPAAFSALTVVFAYVANM